MQFRNPNTKYIFNRHFYQTLLTLFRPLSCFVSKMGLTPNDLTNPGGGTGAGCVHRTDCDMQGLWVLALIIWFVITYLKYVLLWTNIDLSINLAINYCYFQSTQVFRSSLLPWYSVQLQFIHSDLGIHVLNLSRFYVTPRCQSDEFYCFSARFKRKV